jgi:4-amino-4-deoxychorismate lyase
MTARMLIDGVPARGVVSALDRGLAYGDGLFESIRLVGVVAPLWSTPHAAAQRRGLSNACGCRLPDNERNCGAKPCEATRGICRNRWCVSRVTRGMGERGYVLPAASPQPMRVVAAFAPPQVMDSAYAQGVRMRVCAIRLAEQPLLAGMKHLNRLEQVLARAEWDDPAIAEGVLRDSHGRVISATMANLFAVIDGELRTPALDRCGIAGVARAEVLAACPQTQVGQIGMKVLLEAEEIFLTSSVRGILPVQSLGDRNYAPGTITRKLQQHWQNLGFSMEQAG